MKVLRSLLSSPAIGLIVVVGMLGMLYILMGPMHELAAQRNTTYSEQFTAARFSVIAEGMSRDKVFALLGMPLTTHMLDAHVASWAGIESLSFSQPVHPGDFDRVVVWIGTNGTVTWHERAVTD